MKHVTGRRPGAGRALLGVAAALIGVAALSRFEVKSYPPHRAYPQDGETYRLVHAIGNSEKIVADGMSKMDCAARKKDDIAIAEALGIHSKKLGIGSIVCLPENVFDDQ